MKATINDKEVELIEVDKLIELLSVWKRNPKFPKSANFISISEDGYVCLLEQFGGEFDQIGVIRLDIEDTIVFDNM